MTQQQKTKAACEIIAAIVDCIRQLGRVPRGELYARLMAHGCTFDQYSSIERMLVNGKLCRIESDCLVWIVK